MRSILQQFVQLFQKAFFPNRIDFQENGLAAAGGDAAYLHRPVSVLKEGDAQTDPIFPKSTVTLEDPDAATGIYPPEISGVLQAGGNAAPQDPICYPVQ